MIFLRRTLPTLICFLAGIIFIAQYYVPNRYSTEVLHQGSNWVKIIIGFSYLIGLQSLSHLHIQRIRRRQAGWGYSFLVFVGLASMLFFGLVGEVQKLCTIAFHHPFTFANFQDYPREIEGGTAYDWLFKYTYTASAEASFSLLAFFIASAAYRTFRAKSWESALLLIAAVIVIFGRVPLAGMISEWLPWLAEWIMQYPNLAVKRALFIGIAIGIVGTSLRVIFGLERAYIGGD